MNWFSTQIDYIYFVYGLAFLILALFAAPLARARQPAIPWGWLAAFGFIHGIHEWLVLLQVSLRPFPVLISTTVFTLSLSFLFLFEFGRRSWNSTTGPTGIKLPDFLLVALMLALLIGLPSGWTPVLSRYVLALPGSLLAAAALTRLARNRHVAKIELSLAAILLVLYAVAVILRGYPRPHFPEFRAYLVSPTSAFPVELIRAGLMMLLAGALNAINRRLEISKYGAYNTSGPHYPLRRLGLLLAAIVAGGWMLTEALGRYHSREIRRSMVERTETMAALLDKNIAAQLRGVSEDRTSPAFQALQEQLTRSVGVNPDIKIIYLYGLRGRDFFFYVTSDGNPAHPAIGPGELYVGEIEDSDYTVFENATSYTVGPYADQWGYWVTAAVPFLLDARSSRATMALGIDIDAFGYMQSIRQFRFAGIALTVIVCLIILDHFSQHRRIRQQSLALAYSMTATQQANRQLEDQVASRTRELDREKNARLAAMESTLQAESRYRILTEQIPAIAYSVDLHPEPRTTFISPQVREILGYSVAEWLADPVFWRDIIHPDDRECVVDAVVKSNLNGENLDLEYRARDKEGVYRWIHNIGRYLRGPDGAPVHAHGVMFDVTRERRVEEELLKTEKLESLGLLAGGIAHDFNNILTSILGNVSMIRSYLTPEDEQARQLLTETEQASLRARDLTRQLLAFAKGGLPVKRPHWLSRIAREVAVFALRGSQSRLEFESDPGEKPVSVDEGQIAQAIQNLVINADQSMPEGGIVRMRLTQRTIGEHSGVQVAAGDYVRLEVADQGCGIPATSMPKLFDPFFTTKPRGTGLGLTTAHAILRKHGGGLEVRSEPGRGSTFSLYVPVSSEIPGEESRITPPSGPERHSDKARRILVMDDEPSVIQLCKFILEHRGFRVELTADGREAVARYREALEGGDGFDLVILDVTVPGGMGGDEAFAYLKSLDPSVRAVVTSGYSNGDIMANHRLHGYAGVLPKPYVAADLIHVVEACLPHA
jgi:PAS domain S-box-containing protein